VETIYEEAKNVFAGALTDLVIALKA